MILHVDRGEHSFENDDADEIHLDDRMVSLDFVSGICLSKWSHSFENDGIDEIHLYDETVFLELRIGNLPQ